MPPSSCRNAGYKIIGIAEYDGGLYNPNGIDINALVEYRAERRHASWDSKAPKPADSHELLVTDCDILVPAATENVITTATPTRSRRKISVEGANGPTTAAADEILADKKIFVIPDILANAGGVTASYFEWVQDRQGYFWKEVGGERATGAHHARRFDDVVRLRRAAQREQPHRGLHAGHRSRAGSHSPARHLRLMPLIRIKTTGGVRDHPLFCAPKHAI